MDTSITPTQVTPVPAGQAAADPTQTTKPVVIVDADGNPVDVATKADLDAYDPVVVANGEPAIGGRTGQDYLDADSGNLWTYGPTDGNENTEDNAGDGDDK